VRRIELERICFKFELFEGAEDEYKKRHDEMRSEFSDAIRHAGLKNYTLFRRGTLVVGYVEAHPDAATAFANLGASELSAKWSEWFRDLIVNQSDDQGRMLNFTEVWHLD